MKRVMKTVVAITMALVAFPLAPLQAVYAPWDALAGDNWIDTASTPARMYSSNGSGYDLSMAQAKSNGAARGLNSVKFSDGLNNTGHLRSYLLEGSFYIDNTGGQNFTNLLIMVAIDTPTLPGDFSLSLTSRGQTYNLNTAADFAFYNHPEYATGRPSGYYSQTNPTGDPIAYDFATGFVSVIDLTSVSSADPVLPATLLEIAYLFDNMPGRAVFSAYAAQFSSSLITHTNRAVIDLNNPDAALSTFEVVPEPSVLALIACGIAILTRRNPRCPENSL